MKRFSFIFLVSLLSTAASAQQEIKIGVDYGLTGPMAEMCADFRDAALLAIEGLNKRGKYHFTLVEEDNEWQPQKAAAAFQKLADVDGVKFVHIAGSSTSLAVKPLSESRGVLLFTASAQPGITEHSRLVIRHSNIADADARVLAEAVIKKSPKRVASLYINNDWGVAFDAGLHGSLSKISCEYESTSHAPDARDFRGEIAKLLRNKPDVFVVGSFGMSSAMLVKQLRQFGFRGPIFSNNGLALSPEAMALLRAEHLDNFLV